MPVWPVLKVSAANDNSTWNEFASSKNVSECLILPLWKKISPNRRSFATAAT